MLACSNQKLGSLVQRRQQVCNQNQNHLFIRAELKAFILIPSPPSVLLAMRQLLQEPALDDALVASIGEWGRKCFVCIHADQPNVSPSHINSRNIPTGQSQI